jgi:glycosyltransferase involved in cell wall biosynthesis
MQKNYGIELSQGEYLAFIDSDMILDPEVISEALILMSSHRNIGGICIPERSIGEGLFVRLRDYERSFYRGTSIESARFFRKKDVVAVGGFEEGIIFYEESLLPQKIQRMLNLGTHYSIESMISHLEGDITLFSWLKKKFYYGKSIMSYRNTTRSVGIKATQEGQTGIWSRFKIFLMNKKFYEKPFIALGVLGLKSLEFAAG